MKRFFTKTGIWLLAGAALIAVVLCIISALGSGTTLLHNALGVIASPFRAAGSAVVEWVGGIGDHFASIEELQAENEALRQENAQLRQELRPPPRRTSACGSCWISGRSGLIWCLRRLASPSGTCPTGRAHWC